MARHADENQQDVTEQEYLESRPEGAVVENREPQLEVKAEDDPAEGAVAEKASVTPRKTEDKPDTYTVEKGDTLASIGARFKTSPRFLKKLNELDDPNALKVGHTLKLRRTQA